jgi:hypothetical protein
MTKPPPAGPSSDIDGVNQDARAGSPSRTPDEGKAATAAGTRDDTKARPPGTEEKPGSTLQD